MLYSCVCCQLSQRCVGAALLLRRGGGQGIAQPPLVLGVLPSALLQALTALASNGISQHLHLSVQFRHVGVLLLLVAARLLQQRLVLPPQLLQVGLQSAQGRSVPIAALDALLHAGM